MFSQIFCPSYVKEQSFNSSQQALSSKELVMMGMNLFSRKNTMVEHLLQIFHSFLMDESSQVRLNITSQLEHVNKVI